MSWTPDHEVMFLREVVLHDLFQHKEGSRERGLCLEGIAESLNIVETVWFKVDQRALRDKLKKLLQLFVTNKNQEAKQSGINPDHTELDDLLQEIYDRKKNMSLWWPSNLTKSVKRQKRKKKQLSQENFHGKTFRDQKERTRRKRRGGNYTKTKKKFRWRYHCLLT